MREFGRESQGEWLGASAGVHVRSKRCTKRTAFRKGLYMYEANGIQFVRSERGNTYILVREQVGVGGVSGVEVETGAILVVLFRRHCGDATERRVVVQRNTCVPCIGDMWRAEEVCV